MIANVHAPTVLLLVMIASLGRLSAAPNCDGILSLIPLSARVDCSLGARHPLPDSPRITFRQAADVAVFERPLGPQGNPDRLFAIGGPGAAFLVVQGDVDDAGIDLRLDPSGAGSNTGTFGEPDIFQPRVTIVAPGFFFIPVSI